MYNVKVVNLNDEPTEDYHPTLQLCSVLASFSLLFWFLGPTTLLFWLSYFPAPKWLNNQLLQVRGHFNSYI